VTVCDVSDEALHRMKNDIYPKRYGQWDESIRLFHSNEVRVGEFDLICIGTPPDSHLSLALKAMEEKPRAILIEKPPCLPNLELAQEIYEKTKYSSTKIFVGYDHVVGKAAKEVERVFGQGVIGEIITLDAEFREHWAGIFAAHPWLSGPEDSYLGFWQQGGGASGEHSHAINLWQHFAHIVGVGRVIEVEAMLEYVKEGRATYDQLCLLNLKTEKGLIGRVVQDVVTIPPRKRLRLQGPKGSITWVNGYSPEGDAVIHQQSGGPDQVAVIPKKRPDDFIEELKHIHEQLEGGDILSSLDLKTGLDTMLVLAAAHLSENKKCRVEIDYNKGYTLQAVHPCK
jgi:predicted dehydrogenase